MNKTTRVIEDSEYCVVIETIRNGFEYMGVSHKPNPRIAMVLQLERNLGLRISDILRLALDSFVKIGNKYRINIYEKKTGKYRDFLVPVEVYTVIVEYACKQGVGSKTRLFGICERTVSEHLKLACDFLEYKGIGTHSFRKAFATQAYVNSEYNTEVVRRLLQHSSVVTTQRYIGVGEKEIEDTLLKTVKIC